MATLECIGLTKRYGSTEALDSVNLTIEPGKITGLLGPNGSGKTTLIKLANGLLTPNSGEIRIAGMEPCRETRRIVSYLPDRPYLADWMNVRQLLDLFEDFYTDFDRPRALEMLEKLHISEEMRIREMSKGTREKAQLILVMSRRAKLYLLDEPIGGVDPATRRQFWQLIYDAAERGITVFVTTHYMDEAEYCNRISIMVDGKISAMGTPDELKQKFQLPDMDHVFTYLARQARRSSD